MRETNEGDRYKKNCTMFNDVCSVQQRHYANREFYMVAQN